MQELTTYILHLTTVNKPFEDSFVLVPMGPAGKKFFLGIMCQPKQKEITLSDYDRSITKSYEKKGNCLFNKVPQLREQPNQTIPPLKVFSKKDEAIAEFVVETGLSKTQLLGKEEHPIHPGPGSKPFVMREPLMWP